MRGRMPDALFVRHPDPEKEQGVQLVGLLFLLAPTSDPEGFARRLMPQLGPPDELPSDGAVVPTWVDDADAWPCDVQAKAEARAHLDRAPVVAVAMMDADADAPGFFYQQLDPDITDHARAALVEALGETMN
jgi:hypothetical protein